MLQLSLYVDSNCSLPDYWCLKGAPAKAILVDNQAFDFFEREKKKRTYLVGSERLKGFANERIEDHEREYFTPGSAVQMQAS